MTDWTKGLRQVSIRITKIDRDLPEINLEVWKPKGQKKHKNVSQHQLSASILGPQEKYIRLSFAKRDPPKQTFSGVIWGKKRGRKRGISGHKKFSPLFFPSLET